jgi:hypothetical protein
VVANAPAEQRDSIYKALPVYSILVVVVVGPALAWLAPIAPGGM